MAGRPWDLGYMSHLLQKDSGNIWHSEKLKEKICLWHQLSGIVVNHVIVLICSHYRRVVFIPSRQFVEGWHLKPYQPARFKTVDLWQGWQYWTNKLSQCSTIAPTDQNAQQTGEGWIAGMAASFQNYCTMRLNRMKWCVPSNAVKVITGFVVRSVSRLNRWMWSTRKCYDVGGMTTFFFVCNFYTQASLTEEHSRSYIQEQLIA